MKAFTTISLLLTAIVGVSALPSDNTPVVETTVEGEYSYIGQATNAFAARGLEARCGENWPSHSDCVIGQCQCASGYGCYSCNGGRAQCQPGPGSNECWT